MTDLFVDDLLRRKAAYREVAELLRTEGEETTLAVNLIEQRIAQIADFRGATRWPFPTGTKPIRSEKC